MKVVITGTSFGIGEAVAKKFVQHGHEVHGIDMYRPSPSVMNASQSDTCGTYTHYCMNIKDSKYLPDIKGVNILINNAGTQENDCIDVNLKALIGVTEKYGLQKDIKSICNLASVSAHNGAEFGTYCASKGGVISYTRWTAKQIAKYNATCNSISFGGVETPLNQPVLSDDDLWFEIMEMTPLHKWVKPDEAATWIYFLTMINKSCTGQDIIIDNGEFYNHKFIWPDKEE